MQATFNPYDEFLTALKQKAPATQSNYKDAIRLYLQHLDTSDPVRLLDGTQVEKEDAIKGYLLTISHARANNLLPALNMFYRVNRITINWDYFKDYKPKRPEGQTQDEAYVKPQIQTLLKEAPNDRVRLGIYCMSTAGLRVGSLEVLKVRDLTWIEEHSLHCITVYRGTLAEYDTFLTPQASELMYRMTKGRPAESPIFYNLFEPDLPATTSANATAIWRLLVRAGMRVPGKSTERQAIQMDHGFRKFYSTQLDLAGLREDRVERLMDHGPKLVRTYRRPSPLEWLRASGYLDAIPLLTF